VRIRLLTWNIHKCIGGLDRRYDPERIRSVIAHYAPDVVMLQEVDDAARRSRRDRQIDLLGDLLGFRHRIWYPNVDVRGGGHYGNAILSRFPFTSSDNIDLTIPPKKRRSVLHARLRVRLGARRGRTLHIFNMHLGLSGSERKAQLRKFVASHPFQGLDARTPIVVGGDLNDVWGTLGRKAFAPAGFIGNPPIRTFPAYGPVRALDAVYVRGKLEIEKITAARVDLARRASDHLPLVVDMRIR